MPRSGPGYPKKRRSMSPPPQSRRPARCLISANGERTGASKTKLIVEEFSDRLEVTIESAAGAKPEGFRKRLEAAGTDRVRCDGREGLVRVTLIKSCGAAKSGSTT